MHGGRGKPEGFVLAERGQATAEYALLTLWTVVIVISTFEAMRVALLDFYYDLASFLCLPVP